MRRCSLRWAVRAVCLITCQIDAGVHWSHLKKEILNVKRRDGAQLDLTDGWIIHCKQLPCEVRIFFWLRIVEKQIVVSLSARYIHVLMQACMSSGTLVHFAFQLLVQHYSSSKINWLNRLQIKSNKQVIINVLGFTQSPGLCAYRNFSRKIKQAPQVSLHVFGS